MQRKHLALALAAFTTGSLSAQLHGCSGSAPLAQADDAGSEDAGAESGPTLQCAAPSLTPTSIAHYADLVTALEAGAHVRVIVDYSKCQLDGAAGPAAVGGTSMDTFELFGANLIGNAQPFVGVSQTQLIKFGSGFVYDYVRINVNQDDSVEVLVNYLDPTTFAVSVDETLSCALSDGTNGAGVSLFKSAI